MNAYEENGAQRWDEYMRSTAAFLDCGLPNFIEEKFDLISFPSFIVEAVRDGFKVQLNVAIDKKILFNNRNNALFDASSFSYTLNSRGH